MTKYWKKVFLWMGVISFLIFSSCGSSEEKTENKTNLDQNEAVLSGELLSQKYCQSCHLYPEPSVLDKNTWERSVLPLMGRFFGIYEDLVPRSEILEGAINKRSVIDQNIFPPNQLISDGEWNKIVEFYVSNSPESLPKLERKDTLFFPLENFEVVIPDLGHESFHTTLVKLDPETSQIYMGGSKGKLGSLRILNNNFELLEEIRLPTAPMDVGFGNNWLALTLAGSLRLAPSNNLFGELVYLLRNPGEERYSSFQKFLHELNRPVQTLIEDINGNGFDDILIAEFGYYTGALTLYENSGDHKNMYKKTILKNMPGAIKTYAEDMNQDGFKDIVALFAQGEECLSIFYSDGKGGFREDKVLRFNPTYGSVYFEMVDLNSDGFLDILYCNGDNGDYPPILKPYHGIRIFENDGNNNFEMAYFYPLHGAFKSSAEDFDQDGDMDIFAISYFPDFKEDQRQDLIYLANGGGYSFSPQILKEDLPGRWVTFDIGDLDGDGYKDIVLGASGKYQGTTHQREDTEALSMLMLKNRGLLNRK